MVKTVIYAVSGNSDRFGSFHGNPPGALPDEFRTIGTGMSLKSKWVIDNVSREQGREADLYHGPLWFAHISMSEKAHESIHSLIERRCELLPFSYAGKNYWAIYIPWPSDCLDWERSEFWGPGRQQIRRHVFVEEKVPQGIELFRLPEQFEYFCTQEFKDAVEGAGLTGLSFRFVWSSDGNVPKESTRQPKPKKNVQRIVKEPSRRTKRDLLLTRLWKAIDSFGTAEHLDSALSVKSADLKNAQDVIAAETEVLKKAVKCGLHKQELQRLCRSIAYKAVFETLVAIEEECLDRSPALKGLHEDLLMADPQK